jgi:multidrug resistance efflux pump
MINIVSHLEGRVQVLAGEAGEAQQEIELLRAQLATARAALEQIACGAPWHGPSFVRIALDALEQLDRDL